MSLPIKQGDIIRIEHNYKVIPMWMLEELSIRQLRILFDTLIKGDGSRTKTWGKFSTMDREGADRFLMLCCMLGYRASIQKTGYTTEIIKNLHVTTYQSTFPGTHQP